MAVSRSQRRLAVLIDAQNVPASYADEIFAAVSERGLAATRRIYGDVVNGHGWIEAVARHALSWRHVQTNVAGKNSADIGLVIEAMDLLHGGVFDGFCLVSSDSDFTQLAVRIGDAGLKVFGFGEQKTADCFRRACSEFSLLEGLTDGPLPREDLSAGEAANQLDPRHAGPQLELAVAALGGPDGWAQLGELGSHLRKTIPDFSAKSYGGKTLSDLMRRTGRFELDEQGGRGPKRVRRKMR